MRIILCGFQAALVLAVAQCSLFGQINGNGSIPCTGNSPMAISYGTFVACKTGDITFQKRVVTFTGALGDDVLISLQGALISPASFRLLGPNGVVVAESASIYYGFFAWTRAKLPAAGEYRIEINSGLPYWLHLWKVPQFGLTQLPANTWTEGQLPQGDVELFEISATKGDFIGLTFWGYYPDWTDLLWYPPGGMLLFAPDGTPLNGDLWQVAPVTGKYLLVAYERAVISGFSVSDSYFYCQGLCGQPPAPVATQITTQPQGVKLLVDGTPHVTPETFLWRPDESHQVEAPASQTVGGRTLAFAGWSDGGSNPRSLSGTGLTYTANYTESLPCAPTLSGLPMLGAGGDFGTLTVGVGAGCEWTISSDSPWFTFSAARGKGPAQLSWAAQANRSQTARTAILTLGNLSVSVLQTANWTCFYSFSPSALTLPSGAGSVTVKVITDPACPWNPSAGAASSWLTVAPQFGSGPGTFQLKVSANPGDARSAQVTVGAQALSVIQKSERVSTPRLPFKTITPCRILDTREVGGRLGQFGPGFLAPQTIRDVAVPLSSCGIPANAQAYSLNITVVPYGSLGYLAAWPMGSPQPATSVLNSHTGAVTAGAAIVKAGAGGSISLLSSDATEVIVDVNGYFADPSVSSGVVFYPTTPCRVWDTRRAQDGPAMPSGYSLRTVPASALNACQLPANAAAYSANVTLVPTGKVGYLTVFPAGSPVPLVSTLNSFDGKVRANAAIIPAGAGGTFSVVAALDPGATSDVIIDINGYFASPGAAGGLWFYPVDPCRAVDTRATPPALASGVARTLALPSSSCGLPSTAQAYALTLTAVPSGPLGYLTLWPTGTAQPLVSTLNSDGATVANSALVAAGTNGAVNVFAQLSGTNTTNVIVDVLGYFAP